MKIQDVQKEDLEVILRMWQEAGGHIPSSISADQIYHDIQELPRDDFKRIILGDGYRIGSKWTGHSKLRFDIRYDGSFKVRFNLNMDSKYEKKEARVAVETFEKRVSDYFESKSSTTE